MIAFLAFLITCFSIALGILIEDTLYELRNE